MRWRKEKSIWFGLLLLIVLTEWIKSFPELIEQYYSNGIYPFIGIFLRTLFGWLPFSMGDILVTLLIGYFIFYLVSVIKKWIEYGFVFRNVFTAAGTFLKFVLGLYIVFNFLWGFNYYRLGSSYLLNIDPIAYTTDDADTLVSVIQNKLHILATDSSKIEQAKSLNSKLLSIESVNAYQMASNQYPFLAFDRASLKPNLIGKLQSYTGYAGYMFPYTGEAHVNFHSPSYALPFSVCHEMAHQLGFGSESEANLIGFLAAKSSKNIAFKYSAYAGIYSYALRELYFRDTLKARSYHENMPLLLKKDRMEMQQFLEDHKSFLQPGLDVAYNWYLLSQNQEQGLASYNYVVAWLIAYGKKFGWEEI